MRLLLVMSFLISASAFANVYENVKVRTDGSSGPVVKTVKGHVKAPVKSSTGR